MTAVLRRCEHAFLDIPLDQRLVRHVDLVGFFFDAVQEVLRDANGDGSRRGLNGFFILR